MRTVVNQCVLFAGAICVWATGAWSQVPGVQHVVVIGVDGMAPFGIDRAAMPILDDLIAHGASTMYARGVLPTSSSPNWASAIMGAGPEQHGITDNDWMMPERDITPIATSDGRVFPTIFWLLRQQQPTATIGIFYDWDGFGLLMESSIADKKVNAISADHAVDAASAYFAEARPLFTFIHLDHVDHAGHTSGWDSTEYTQALENADARIGKIIESTKSAGMYERTLFLIISDHGGKGKGHGGDSMAEIEIPWIIVGPGVKKGHTITQFVNTYDTAATLAYVFGLKPHEAWIAKPVLDAFEGK